MREMLSVLMIAGRVKGSSTELPALNCTYVAGDIQATSLSTCIPHRMPPVSIRLHSYASVLGPFHVVTYRGDMSWFQDNIRMKINTRCTFCYCQGVVDGYNATVFAYGCTGAGKTYTMIGNGQEGHQGIMVLTLQDLFKQQRRVSGESPWMRLYHGRGTMCKIETTKIMRCRFCHVRTLLCICMN